MKKFLLASLAVLTATTAAAQIDTVKVEKVVVKARLLSLYGAKETRFFTETERSQAISGLELMKNLPQIALNNSSNKLTTLAGKSILILCDGIKIDETDP